MPEIPDAIGRGDFAPPMAWLGRKMHGLGALTPSGERIEHATGKPLDPKI